MQPTENLNQFINTYTNDPFLTENLRGLNRYVHCCIKNSVGTGNYLELGIGHGVTLEKLSNHFERIVVLEGASELVHEYRDKYRNVEIIETFFESYKTDEKFDNIGMGFILEHVDDPAAILKHYAAFLSPNGRILIGVPSASSMHRQIAQAAGLLDDLRQLSTTDIAFGHKRLWTCADWKNLLLNLGFTLDKVQGIALKPFSTGQLNSLNLSSDIVAALDELALNYPELANALFIEASYAD
jgi:trans-aconitate methyltransferase